MSNYGICWRHRCTYSREASADRPRVDHSSRENSVASSFHFRESAGKLAAVFSLKRKPSQVSDRAFSQDINQIEEKTTLFKSEAAARLVLEERQDHLLAEAKSEILMQECIVDALNTREFQRQLIPIVWKWIP